MKRNRYKTLLGSFISLISVLVMISFTVIYINELISKGSFTLVSSIYKDSKNSIDFSNIPILLALTNSMGEILDYDEKLFSFSVLDNNNIVTSDEKGIQSVKVVNTPIEVERCDKIKNFPLLTKYFGSYNLSSFICIKPNQNLTMQGKFGDRENGFKGFRIYLNRCNSEKRDCYDLDYMISKLSNIKLTFLTLENGIDHYSANNNNVFYEISSTVISFSTTFMKKYYFSLSTGHYLLNTGIFFNSKKDILFYQFSSWYMDFESSSVNSLTSEPAIGCLTFNCDNTVREYQKHYLKLSGTLGSIGGCLNTIFTIAQFVNWYFVDNLLFIDIIEKILLNKKNIVESFDDSKRDTSFKMVIPKIEKVNNNDLRTFKKKITKKFYCCPLSVNVHKDPYFSKYSDMISSFLGIEYIYNVITLFNSFNSTNDLQNEISKIEDKFREKKNINNLLEISKSKLLYGQPLSNCKYSI